MVTFNPDCQMQICDNADLCFFGDYPTLAKIREYGKNTPVIWLVPQLINLSEYCGCKEKLKIEQLEEVARIIARDFYYLKISEIMLFFSRFKSGYYGKFYGAVDPLVIMKSLRIFVQDRRYVLVYHDQERKYQEKIESEKRAVSYETYKKMYKTRIEEPRCSEEG